MTERSPSFNSIIGLVLRVGVIVSCSIIALGTLLLFVEGQTGYSGITTEAQLSGRQEGYLIGIAPLIQGVGSGKPYAIIDLGLIVLLATPVARVAISIPLFVAERRFAFATITSVVLAVLLVSIFIVAPILSS